MLQKQNKIICQVCFKALTSHNSIVAGMGPVCRERLRFAEEASSEILETMRGNPEIPNSRSLLPFRNVIFQEKESKNNLLSSILGVNNGVVVFVERQKLTELYKSNDISYSEAFSQCVGLIQNHEIEAVHSLEKPDHPQFRREFNEFSKIHKKHIEERIQISEKRSENELDYSFGNVDSVRELTVEQHKNREEMMKLQNLDKDKFNQLYASAEFHLATFLKRLENSEFSEVLEIRKILLKKYVPQVDVKDYGLTKKEIVSSLQSANKNIEKNLYKAFVEGNTNLNAIIDIFNRQEKLEPKDKILSIKVINALINDPYMTQGHKDSMFYDQVRGFIKLYSINNCHSNWKK